MSAMEFVKGQLKQPGVDLDRVARECDVSVRTLQMLKAGVASNTSVERIERIALHFGYRFKPVKATRLAAGGQQHERAA